MSNTCQQDNFGIIGKIKRHAGVCIAFYERQD